MKKTNSNKVQPPLENGQLWRMADAELKVGFVGKYLVHYKLGRGGATGRLFTACDSIKLIEKYLKDHKAVLV